MYLTFTKLKHVIRNWRNWYTFITIHMHTLPLTLFKRFSKSDETILIENPYILDLTFPYLFSFTEMDSFSKVQEEVKTWKWQYWTGCNPRHQIFMSESKKSCSTAWKVLRQLWWPCRKIKLAYTTLLHPFSSFFIF